MTDDTHQWECAECEAKNALSMHTCRLCKARRPEQRINHAKGARDPRFCSFVSANGMQCPLPGDLQHRAEGQRWCVGHFKDPIGAIAEQVFDDAWRNQSAIMAKTKAGNDLLAWWESEGRAQREKEKVKTPPVDEVAEAERRRQEVEQIAAEAVAERAAIQTESGAFPDESF